MTDACSALGEAGFVWIRSTFATSAAAFARPQELIEECAASNGHAAMGVIGDFIPMLALHQPL